MGNWTLVIRDMAGVELRIAIDETIDAMPGGTNLNIGDLQYIGVFSEQLGADVCGLTIPTEQQVIDYLGGAFSGNPADERRADDRLRRQTQPQNNFRRGGLN